MTITWGQIFTTTLLQSLLTSGIIGVIGYIIQREHKLLDTYKSEKHKALLQKTIDAENSVYDVIKIVRSNYIISSNDFIVYANQINQIRLDQFLYITEKVYTLSTDFADYLLEVAADDSLRNHSAEVQFIDSFKKEFRK